MPINLTEEAATEIKRIISTQEGLDIAYLRVGCKGGGCSGFSYILDLVEEKRESDELFELHGVQVICDSRSYLYLNGVKIDFQEGLMRKGFVFDNPNANSTCGCGSSFGV